MLSSIIASVMAFITSLFGGADGSSSIDTVEAAPAPPTEQVQVAPEQTETASELARDEALAIAFERAGVTADRVTHLDDAERERDDGRRIWEIEFHADGHEHEFDIDAHTGEILEYERDHEGHRGTTGQQQNPAPSPAPAQNERITLDRAIEIALEHSGVTDPHWDDRELDSDDGRVSYELEFEAGGWEYEYDIDAYTGEIIEFERDHDD